jgi:hypothetical protein
MKTQYFLTRNVSRLWYETCEAYEKEDCAVKKFCSLGVLAAITKLHRTSPSSSSKHLNVCETCASCSYSRLVLRCRGYHLGAPTTFSALCISYTIVFRTRAQVTRSYCVNHSRWCTIIRVLDTVQQCPVDASAVD